MCALSVTKLKVSSEFMIVSIKAVKGGVGERCYARERVAIMLIQSTWNI
jgi:hypothetical protein